MNTANLTATVSKCKPGEIIGREVAPKDDIEGYVSEVIREPAVRVRQGSQVVYVTRDIYREIKRQLGK
jgi:hypothetical protein